MTRILLGMSGGVDSTVAASLMKRDGHEVVGATLLFHDTQAAKDKAQEAAELCEKLEIEHHVVDVRQRYEDLVAKRALEEFQAGREFDAAVCEVNELLMPVLYELRKKHKFRKIATGHYAGVVDETVGIGTYPLRLMEALDRSKDQSFLLYHLTQKQLNLLEFPLGKITMMEVRIHAMQAGLMIPELDVDDTPKLFGHHGNRGDWLVSRGVAAGVGDARSVSNGQVLGTHQGVHYYSQGDWFHVGEGRLRVVMRDLKNNELLLGGDSQASSESCVVQDVHWTSIHPLESQRSCKVKLNVRDTARPVNLVPMENGNVVMSSTMPMLGLASGKTVVFYSDTMVLGGGTIA